jgi:uncharacterized protein YjbI with pentapeptide repeats
MAPIQSPRLPAVLLPLDEPALDDGVEWAGAEVTGDIAGPPDVDEVEMTACRLVSVRLTGRRFERLRMVDVLIEDSELSGVTIAEGSFLRVEMRRCRLSGLVASTLKAKHVRLVDCRVDGAMFRMTRWEHAELRDCDLRDADFHASALAGVRLLGCDLTGADFSKATMAGAALHGSTVAGIRGADSLRGAVVAGDQVFSLALPVLAALGITVDDGYLDPPADGLVNPRRLSTPD